MSKPVLAFFGYARAADEATDGAIGDLHGLLQARVRARSGRRDFELWRDNLSIRWGQAWEQRLLGAIDEALFYVPVLTPDFFESEWCCKEADAFLDRIARGDSRTRVLPIYLLDDLRFDRPAMRRSSPIRARIHAHQFRDLREHLNADWRKGDALKAVDVLAKEIADRVVEIEHEEDTIAVVAPLLEAGDLAAAERELRESDFPGEAARCAAVSAAFNGRDWEGARRAVVEGRRGLLGERWAVGERLIEAAVAEERAAADAALRVPGVLRHTALAGAAPLPLVYIPAGTFQMGSPTHAGALDEHPQHRVTISRPFLVGVTPVTQAQWSVLAASAGLPVSPSTDTGKSLPVESVSWFEVVRWCNALSASEGRPLAYAIGDGAKPRVEVELGVQGYRLPTEAEWEYFCRAGTTTSWSSGEEEQTLRLYAWFALNAKSARPVGLRRPNGWGLKDVHGNVWEWVNDEGKMSYSAEPCVDPLAMSHLRVQRVVRGGSWREPAEFCRSASRGALARGGRDDDLGFRIILPLPPES